VQAATPTITTVAAAPNANGQLRDTATVTGGNNPTGTVSFRLYPGTDCNADPIYQSPNIPLVNGTATSDLSPNMAPGTYHWNATYNGDNNNNLANGACPDPNETVTVPNPQLGRPTITTVAAAPNANGQLRDTATVTGGNNPTGTVSFRLYSTPDCSGGSVYNSTVPLANGTATSNLSPNMAPGQYHWIATYDGDANNNPVSGNCGDPNENPVVPPPPAGPSSISVTKTADPLSRPVPGGAFTFTVVVTNTGTVPVAIESLVDDIYGNVATRPSSTCGSLIGTIVDPGQSAPPCSFTVSFTAPQPTSQTDVVTATAVDLQGRHPQAHDDATITLTRRAPTITTEASPTVLLGGSVSDQAELHDASTPTGTVTFRLYGPDDATCARTPAFTTSKQLDATTRVTSDAVTPTQTGTYRWVASYGGDVNNAPVSGACNDPLEQVLVQPVPALRSAPTVVVRKDAIPASRPAPGGNFTFRVRVTNTSSRPLTLTSLVDSVYGNLDGLGTCDVPVAIASGATYECEFTGVFMGDAGDSETDVVTATAVDRDEQQVRASDDATVTLTATAVVPTPTTTTPAAPTTTTTTTTTPPTVLPVTIPRTGGNTAMTAAWALVVLSFGALAVGLADERRRRIHIRP
jgi:uncharacterized repeat protein (TIGR01451 family)